MSETRLVRNWRNRNLSKVHMCALLSLRFINLFFIYRILRLMYRD